VDRRCGHRSSPFSRQRPAALVSRHCCNALLVANTLNPCHRADTGTRTDHSWVHCFRKPWRQPGARCALPERDCGKWHHLSSFFAARRPTGLGKQRGSQRRVRAQRALGFFPPRGRAALCIAKQKSPAASVLRCAPAPRTRGVLPCTRPWREPRWQGRGWSPAPNPQESQAHGQLIPNPLSLRISLHNRDGPRCRQSRPLRPHPT